MQSDKRKIDEWLDKGSHMLNGANMNNMEVHIVLGVSGHEKENYKAIKTALGGIFQGDNEEKD